MTEYRDLLIQAIKTARKAYICEPTREGKREWLYLIKSCKKELNELTGKLVV